PIYDPVVFDSGPGDLALYESVTEAPKLTFDSEDLLDGATLGTIGYRWLFVAIPDTGQIQQIRWNLLTNTLMPGPPLTLGAAACTPGATPPQDQTLPLPDTASDYNRICPDSPGAIAREVKTVQTTQTCTDGLTTGPRPVSLHVDDGGTPDDASDDVLLVADANQPVIHRFSLGPLGAVPLDTIATGTPTRHVVTTPFVPATVDNRDATQRYLYAISAFDSSIVAIDYTPPNPFRNTFGEVLPILAGISGRANEEGVESRNRNRNLFANVRAIEVLTPEYEVVNGRVPVSSLCDPTDGDEVIDAQNAANMRGVFLAVSISTGDLLFLDIYDLNALCRGSGCDTVTEPDAFVSIRRHRRRFGFTPSDPIEISGTPSLVFNASQGTIDPDTGEPRNSDGPGLERITCPESLGAVFGQSDPPGPIEIGFICSSTQPWSTPTERWDARLGGLIPTSEGGGGSFSDTSSRGIPRSNGGLTWFQATSVPFCQIGVLGAVIGSEPTLLPGAPEETGIVNTQYGGDRLLITGELAPAQLEDPICEQIFGDIEDEIDDFPVWFPIIRAFEDELELGRSPNPNRYELSDVERCYPNFIEFQVHTQGVYTVVGTQSGFIHRTAAAPAADGDIAEGECILDDTRPITCTDATPAMSGTPIDPCPAGGDNTIDVDTLLAGRAFPDVQFTNPLVSFQIGPFSDEVPITDGTFAELSFSIFNGFRVLITNTSGTATSLPASLLFAPEFDQLFFVDLQSGVRQFDLEPLSTIEIFQ
ncbi:MAG: hypothetical protein WBG86_20060, partial [Polyangiales bacterium]